MTSATVLALYPMLCLDYGARLERFQPRLPPAEMLREAAGIGLDEMITLGFLYWSCLLARTPDDPLAHRQPDWLNKIRYPAELEV